MATLENAVDNLFLAERITGMRDAVSRGESLTQGAEGAKLFPQMVIQMISVGEASGMLDDMLTEIAHYYDREVDYQRRKLQ